MTSLLPSRSTATTCCAPQSASHKRPSGPQRGDSPNTRPVIKVCRCTLPSPGVPLLVRPAVEVIGVHGSLLDELLGSDGVEGDRSPSLLVHEESVPRRRWDRHPPLLGSRTRLAHQPARSPALCFTDLEDSAAGERERALIAVGMPFWPGLSPGADAGHPAPADARRQATAQRGEP